MVAQPFVRNERYGCGIPPAGAISCRNYRPRTKQQTPEKPAAANLFTIHYSLFTIHCSLAALYAGKLSLISVPFPTSLCILISALWKAAACFTMDSPKPVPPIAFEWLLSTR